MQMMALGVILLAAHLGGKLADRLRMSEVTGQLVGGALTGPYVLGLLGLLPAEWLSSYRDAVHSFHFFIFVFLSMVAFGIGEELYIHRLKKVGKSALVICLIQAFLTWVLISAAFYYIGKQPLMESLLIGSIGIATAPAVSFVLMNKLRIEGRLRNLLGSMVVLDDMIEVIIFSVMLQTLVQRATGSDESIFGCLMNDVFWALVMGGAIFLVLRFLVLRHARSLETLEPKEEKESAPFLQSMLTEHPSPSVELLIVTMGSVALATGVAYYFHWPFLITAVFAGFIVSNFHSHAIFDSMKIENISPIFNLIFFALIGANISLAELNHDTALLVGLYIVTRSIAKIFGTWVGCKIMKEDRKITVCLPRLMLPQAGVAAVEAVYASAILGNPAIAAIILPAIVFFEVAGIFWVDQGLRKWQSWVSGEDEVLRHPQPSGSGVSEAARKLLVSLNPESIALELKAQSKQEIIEELVAHARLVSEQHIDLAQCLQLLGEREKLAPTTLGNGVAAPHCRLLGVERTVLVFGKSRHPIVFGTQGQVPCDLFLLMITPARDAAEHLQLLAATGRLMSDLSIRESLRSAKTPQEVLDILDKVAKN